TDQMSSLDVQLQAIRRQLYDLTQGISLELKVELYQHALSSARHYERRLNQIHHDHVEWLNLIESGKMEQIRLAEYEDETDDLRGTLNVLEDRVSRLEQQVEHLQHQQQLKGAEDV